VVLASDSRTNAGIDRVSTFRKMFTFEKPGDRFFALLTAGNLSLTQGVISLVSEWLNSENPEKDLYAVNSMFGAARVIGTAIREVHKIDGGYLQQHDVDFSASFILAGQLKGGQLRLFLIYDAGNFIEAMGDTNYFQIGEVKYGKPILDRIIRHNTSLSDAAECDGRACPIHDFDFGTALKSWMPGPSAGHDEGIFNSAEHTSLSPPSEPPLL
jgi:putative proteasome-type protease